MTDATPGELLVRAFLAEHTEHLGTVKVELRSGIPHVHVPKDAAADWERWLQSQGVKFEWSGDGPTEG